MDSERQKIISSVFDKRNAAGSDETYITHVKIWEEEGQSGGRKARYILLSRRSPNSP
jgi:exocyst complex component 1